MVFKLVSRQGSDGEWVDVAKKSTAKATVAGQKFPVRTMRDGDAFAETIYLDPPAPSPVERSLDVRLVTAGEPDPRFLGAAGTELARARRAASIAELPAGALRLSRGDPALPTVYI
jgi:nicotinate phosphoribosyltransferase